MNKKLYLVLGIVSVVIAVINILVVAFLAHRFPLIGVILLLFGSGWIVAYYKTRKI